MIHFWIHMMANVQTLIKYRIHSSRSYLKLYRIYLVINFDSANDME